MLDFIHCCSLEDLAFSLELVLYYNFLLSTRRKQKRAYFYKKFLQSFKQLWFWQAEHVVYLWAAKADEQKKRYGWTDVMTENWFLELAGLQLKAKKHQHTFYHLPSKNAIKLKETCVIHQLFKTIIQIIKVIYSRPYWSCSVLKQDRLYVLKAGMIVLGGDLWGEYMNTKMQ